MFLMNFKTIEFVRLVSILTTWFSKIPQFNILVYKSYNT